MIALVAGILVTVVASLRPAFRATRVPPLAAVHEGATLPPSRFAFLRVPGSILLTVLGFAALSWALFGPGHSTTGLLVWMGVGALMIFLGVALLSERLVRPLATWLGWPSAKIGGTAGALAREQLAAKPAADGLDRLGADDRPGARHARAVLAAGIVSTFRSAVDDLWKNADYALTAQNNFSPIPVSVAAAAAKAPGVDAVGSVRAGQAKAFGSVYNATAVNPATSRIFALDWKDGSDAVLARLGERRRVRRRGLCGRPRPEGRLDASTDLCRRPIGDVPGAGHLQAADRRIAVRPGHDLGQDVGPLQRPAAGPLLVRDHEGRRNRREQSGARQRVADVPERQGADAARSSSTTRSQG